MKDIEENLAENNKKNTEFSDEKNKELIKRYRENNDLKAKDELVTRNLGLIKSIVFSKFGNLKYIIDDLIQEGVLAFIYAIEKFDYNSDNIFYKYAEKTIINNVTSYINRKEHLIKATNKSSAIYGKYLEYYYKYVKDHNEEPTNEQVANALEIEESLLEKILVSIKDGKSLNDKIFSCEGEIDLIDNLISDSAEISFEKFEDSIYAKQILEEIMKKLSIKECYILKSYLGFNEERTAYNSVQIAKKLNLTRQRIESLLKSIEYKTGINFKAIRNINGKNRKHSAEIENVTENNSDKIEYITENRTGEDVNKENIQKNKIY